MGGGGVRGVLRPSSGHCFYDMGCKGREIDRAVNLGREEKTIL